MSPARRRLVVAAAVVATALVLVATARPVAAQEAPPTSAPQVSMPDIIPQPNSGHEPVDATDRGGWAQYAVLGGIVVALGVIAGLVARESRQARRSRTRNEPVADTSENSPDSSARQ